MTNANRKRAVRAVMTRDNVNWTTALRTYDRERDERLAARQRLAAEGPNNATTSSEGNPS